MLDLLALFRLSHPSGTRTIYIAPSGSDANPGTSSSAPKLTIQSAIDSCQAGDRILVNGGSYGYTQAYGKNGSSTKWITIEGSNGAKIDLSAGMNGNNGMNIQLSSFFAVFGLEVVGIQSTTDTANSGISIFRASHHIAVWKCNVHDWPAGGINCFYVASSVYNGQTLPGGGWDCVDLFFNTIHGTSKYSEYNGSGISFYAATDITGSTIDGTYGYRAVGNYIYDVICTVPYTPGGFNFVTDGNGISPDSLAVANNLNPDVVAYTKRGLIEGNIIVACGGRGVLMYNSVNLDVVNNTLIGNLRTNSPAINGSSEIATNYDTSTPNNGVNISGNVIAPLNTNKTIDTQAQTVTGNTILGGTDTITAGNVNARATGLGWFTTAPTEAQLIAGVNPATLIPVNPAKVSRTPHTMGYQALGMAGRNPTTVAVGALEKIFLSTLVLGIVSTSGLGNASLGNAGLGN